MSILSLLRSHKGIQFGYLVTTHHCQVYVDTIPLSLQSIPSEHLHHQLLNVLLRLLAPRVHSSPELCLLLLCSRLFGLLGRSRAASGKRINVVLMMPTLGIATPFRQLREELQGDTRRQAAREHLSLNGT